MSFAYLPLYTGDYLRDTRHLTPLRHGVYLLILMHCWDTQGPAPLDEQELCGIANCRSADEVEALRYVLARFFTRMEDGHYQERLQREIEKAENISRERSQAGKKGYEARSKAIVKQLPSKSLTLASTHPHTIPSHAIPTKPTTVVDGESEGKTLPRAKALGSRLPKDWSLPDEWRDWAKAIRPDWSLQGIVRESLTFRDHWHAKAGKDASKADWLATWRNWIRRAEYEPTR